MKKYIIGIILAVIVLGGILFFVFTRNNHQEQNPSASGTRVNTEVNNVDASNIKNNSNTNNETVQNEISQKEPTETEIAKSSTKILVDDDNRDNNLELTGSKINGYVVKIGEEFSFNDVVGNPTPDEGYEKAGIIVNGKKEKGYGGGNCQISSTLYDAARKIDGLKITERHEHGKDVGYIEEGKDATVVYDELDLSFKNNTENDIKIYVDVTSKEVKVKLVKLSY